MVPLPTLVNFRRHNANQCANAKANGCIRREMAEALYALYGYEERRKACGAKNQCPLLAIPLWVVVRENLREKEGAGGCCADVATKETVQVAFVSPRIIADVGQVSLWAFAVVEIGPEGRSGVEQAVDGLGFQVHGRYVQPVFADFLTQKERERKGDGGVETEVTVLFCPVNLYGGCR